MNGSNGRFRRLEINGGQVIDSGETRRFELPPVAGGYTDAQIDDYGAEGEKRLFYALRRHFSWRPGVVLQLRARFSHSAATLKGTAGFGFWNAPFGDPSFRWPALPQAAWFFFGSPPTDLPLADDGPGRGWFAGTLDATTGRALAWAPLALPVLLVNQLPAVRRRLWPRVQRDLGISFTAVPVEMTDWHEYELRWLPQGCEFRIGNKTILKTTHSPTGALGFVCWIDNQYLVARENGRFAWGTLQIEWPQWMEIAGLRIGKVA